MVFARRRPLLRTAAVGGGMYLAGKRSAQRNAGGQDAAQDVSVPQQQRAAESQQASGPPASVADQLNQLADLHSRNVLSDDEFAAAKAKLLRT